MEEVKKGNYYRLLVPRLTVLITTVNKEGRDNAAPFSFVMPVSFNPPLLSFACIPRWHTYKNVRANKEFVVNVPSKEMLQALMVCGKPFPEGISEIDKASLTRINSVKVKPPRIKEAVAWLECKLVRDIPAGDHHILMGEVLSSQVKKEFWADKRLSVEKVLNPLHISGNLFSIPKEITLAKEGE
jgi:flavin reductase (DIM6/NTAB) family NADH-FMN oxidoreductase RutF